MWVAFKANFWCKLMICWLFWSIKCASILFSQQKTESSDCHKPFLWNQLYTNNGVLQIQEQVGLEQGKVWTLSRWVKTSHVVTQFLGKDNPFSNRPVLTVFRWSRLSLDLNVTYNAYSCRLTDGSAMFLPNSTQHSIPSCFTSIQTLKPFMNL